jgi:hypothetical protein
LIILTCSCLVWARVSVAEDMLFHLSITIEQLKELYVRRVGCFSFQAAVGRWLVLLLLVTQQMRSAGCVKFPGVHRNCQATWPVEGQLSQLAVSRQHCAGQVLVVSARFLLATASYGCYMLCQHMESLQGVTSVDPCA